MFLSAAEAVATALRGNSALPWEQSGSPFLIWARRKRAAVTPDGSYLFMLMEEREAGETRDFLSCLPLARRCRRSSVCCGVLAGACGAEPSAVSSGDKQTSVLP